jgi:hypothetical protein
MSEFEELKNKMRDICVVNLGWDYTYNLLAQEAIKHTLSTIQSLKRVDVTGGKDGLIDVESNQENGEFISVYEVERKSSELNCCLEF